MFLNNKFFAIEKWCPHAMAVCWNRLTEMTTFWQDFYKLNGKPVYVLVESREYEK